MSDRENTKKPAALTQSGSGRRRFLSGTAALAAAGTSAVALLPGLRSAVAAADAVPTSCPKVPTPMKDVEGKVAFITGGDSGIGLGIARVFADAGMKVVITYRSKSHLDEAMKALEKAGDRVHAISLDVSDRAAMEQAAVETIKVFGKVHVIVNNAGVGVGGPLSKATYDDWDWGMGVNCTGVFNGIRTFLPRIQAQGEGGQVIATSSLAGLLAHASLGVYTASKFAVTGMMEALRNELVDTNVGVTVFCPGIVSTNIGDSNRNRPSTLSDAAPRPKAPKAADGAPKKQPPFPGMDPLEAGQLVLRGMRNNDLYVLTTPEFGADFASRGEAIVASVPLDVHSSPEREAVGRKILGQTVYAAERDRRRCERPRSRKA